MNSPLEKALSGVTNSVVAYMPNLLAGVVLLLIGWLLGWIIKRIVVQVMLVLRIDQLTRRLSWGRGFSKADVRYAFAEAVGNIAFLIVFLVLLDAALEALQLTVISEIIRQGMHFIPRVLMALFIFGVGWFLAGTMAAAIQRALTKEGVPRATLIARFAKTVVMIFVGAMALNELDFAREIVLIGFSVTIITLGVLAIVMAIIGGKKFMAKIFDSMDE